MKTRLLILSLLLSAIAFGQLRVQTVSIAINASASSSIKPQGACIPAAILMPAAWTAAGLSPEISVDNSTYYPIYDEYGSMVILQASTSRAIRLSPADYFGAGIYFRLRSVNASTGAAVTQAAARTLTILCR